MSTPTAVTRHNPQGYNLQGYSMKNTRGHAVRNSLSRDIHAVINFPGACLNRISNVWQKGKDYTTSFCHAVGTGVNNKALQARGKLKEYQDIYLAISTKGQECWANRATIAHNLKVQSNEIYKSDPRVGRAVNTARNTTCLATPLTLAYVTSSYLLPAPLSILAYGAAAVSTVSRFQAILNTKDEHVVLNRIISQLDVLTKQDTLTVGNEPRVSFSSLLSKDPNQITLYDCIHLIDDLVYNESRNLFNLHSLTGSNKEVLERLKRQLEGTVQGHAHDDTERLSNDLKKAVQEALSTLTELKATRSGYSTTSYQRPDVHPRLKELSSELIQFQERLQNRSEIPEGIASLKDILTICIETPSVLIKITGNTERKELLIEPPSDGTFESLKKLRDNLDAFIAFVNPASCLNLVKNELKEDFLNPVLQLCHERLSASETKEKYDLDHAINPANTTLALQGSIKALPQDPCPFKRLHSTLDVLKTDWINWDEDYKKNHIIQLLKGIDVALDDPMVSFEGSFLEYVGKDSQDPNPLNWAKNNLFAPGIDLTEAFNETLIGIARQKGYTKAGVSMDDDINFLSS